MRRLAVASEHAHADATSARASPSTRRSIQAMRKSVGMRWSTRSAKASSALSSGRSVGAARAPRVASSGLRSSPRIRSSLPRRKWRRTKLTAIRVSQGRSAAGSRSLPSCSNPTTKASCTTSSPSQRLDSSRVAMASRWWAWRRYSTSLLQRSPPRARATSSASPSASALGNREG